MASSLHSASGKLVSSEQSFVPLHLPYLDGLRAIAVLLVLFGHLPFVPGLSIWNMAWSANQWAHGANLGVDIFFVLSGFLISRILLQERARTGGISLRIFYAKRALRIFPIYYLAIAFCALYFGLTGAEAISLVFYAFNYFMSLHPHPHPLEHTWSLAIEEQFYLVWPFLVRFLPLQYGLRVTGAVIPLLSIGLALALSSTLDPALAGALVNQSTPTRMMSLSLGAFLAFSERRGIVFKSWIALTTVAMGIGLIACATYGKKMGVISGGGYFWCMVLAGSSAVSFGVVGSLVLCPSEATNFIRNMLATQTLRHIGKISYGIYLYHLIIMFALKINPAEVATTGTSFAHLALAIILTVIVAELSYKYIESPLLRLKGSIGSLRPRAAETLSAPA